MDIREYEKAVEGFANTNSSFVFNNSGLDHAAIFTKTIYKFATKIRMLCYGLGSALALDSRYLTALQEFLNKPNSELTIIIISRDHLDGPALKMIRDKVKEFPDRFSIFHSPLASNYTEASHIMIGDDRIFRVEHTPATFEAYGSFNKPEIVQKLNGILDEIISISTEINPAA